MTKEQMRLGRLLYPELDLWGTAKPFLERWMKAQVGPEAFLARLKRNLPKASEQLPALPDLAHKVLTDASEGRLKVHWENPELERIREEIRRANRRNLAAVSGLALLALGLWLGGPPAPIPAPLTNAAVLAAGAVGALLLIVAWRS
jgi:ubiquinone biosynthesis protein